MNMKKEYMMPQMEVVKIQQTSVILAGSGDKLFGDNPQNPGNAMSPEFDMDF